MTAIVGLTIVKMISLVEIIGIKDSFGKIQQSLAHVNHKFFYLGLNTFLKKKHNSIYY